MQYNLCFAEKNRQSSTGLDRQFSNLDRQASNLELGIEQLQHRITEYQQRARRNTEQFGSAMPLKEGRERICK